MADILARGLAASALTNLGLDDSLPTGFPWNRGALDVRPYRSKARASGSALTAANLIPSAVWSAPIATQVFHVDPVNGLDTNTGIGTYWGDFASSPVKTVLKAVQLANATTLASVILIKADTNPVLNRAATGLGSATFLTVSASIQAIGGRATFAATDAHTFTLNDAPTATYTATESNTSGVIDLLNQRWIGDDLGGRCFDRNGVGRQSHVEFTRYASLAALKAATFTGTTGGGFYNDNAGGGLFIRRADGAAVTDTNSRSFRGASAASAPAFSTGNSSSAASLHMAGIDFQGGFQSINAGTRNVWLDGCRGMYATLLPTSGTTLGGNGFASDFAGTTLLTNCEGWANGADVFNLHGVNGLSQMVTVNCLGWDTGRGSSQSNNGLTGHESTSFIDFGGDYQYCRGGSARFINNSRFLLYGTRILNDLGDVILGGSIPPTSVRTDGTALGWVFYSDLSSTNALVAAAGTIYTRGNFSVTGAVSGSIVPV